MDRPPHRRLEELSVGLYVPLVLGSGLGVVAVLQIDAPYVGAFVAFWLVVLCLFAAVVTATVVLAVNLHRVVGGADYDPWAVLFAAAIPAAVGVALAVLIAGPSPRVIERVLLATGLLALVLAPAGLVLAVFGGHLRRRLGADA